jgi:hypothetical protein
VLYLGATEVRYNATTRKVSAARYYRLGDRTVAVRTAIAGTTGSKLNFLAGDQHGTASLAVDGSIVNGTPAAQTFTKRYTTPFGASRGSNPSAWPDDKGFLGHTADATTGLIDVGAREYDAVIGRFPVRRPGVGQSRRPVT